MPEVAEGSIVDGRYRVVQRLGSGGMADVWLADDTHLQRRVALKILHDRLTQDREFVDRFRREAESAAGLQHPNVVSVFDRGAVDGTYYIAMQYLEGRTLRSLIDHGLAIEESVRLIRQVLEAARFAHRHGVVHRDFKPSNVIVDAEAKATVTDFGIARAGVSEITRAGSVMGTPHYLSPEQAQGHEVTPVSDLYSIGVMLYEALTHRLPFEAESPVAVAMKQVSETPQRPSSINPQVSPALDAVVMRALEKDPAQRFQSADAFIAALDQAMRDPGATAAFPPPPPVEPPPEEPPPERRRIWPWAVLLAAIVGGLLAWALTRDTTTDVPRVTGQQLSVAVSLLQQDGFDVGEIKRVRRPTPRNLVLEQDPIDSASLDCAFLSFFCSKPSVTLTVSSGPGRAKVPSTAGLAGTVASQKVEDAGFVPVMRAKHSDDVPKGQVIYSNPRGGTLARRGSRVILFVSSGPVQVSVPVLVGSQRSVAVQRLRAHGLVPDVSEEESSAPAGQVIRQSPSAGTKVDPGSTVSLVVSKGVEQAKVPNVIGSTRSSAVAAIRAAGLTPSVTEQETDVPSQNGRVTDQFPPPGSEVDPDTTVTIIVGKLPPAQPPPQTTPTTPVTP